LVTADLEAVSVQSKENWFASHSEHHRPLWIVIAEGSYAGWMSFGSFYGRPAYDGVAELSIYLEEAFRGKGIGRTCLLKAIATAPEFKLHTLLGFIFGHNTASLNLFYGFGFKQWGLLPAVADMDGTMRDLAIVGKKIQ
jgi:L-amino acid N-acyltransferase YncA